MAVRKKNNKLSPAGANDFQNRLLDWYDRHQRVMPWRVPSGVTPEPYHVWLSEIMLQQTVVNAVVPYFLKFTKKWPNVHKLAKAKQEDVMREWAGLGYYARARNLHACATVVSNELKGVFPDTEADLKKLPGIGDYTAAAIMTIAHNKNTVVMDGNIERVTARYFAFQKPIPKEKPALKKLAGKFFADCKRPGDMAQALMDLGATICIPGKPRCSLCPLSADCKARKKNIAEKLPIKEKPKARPQKYGHVYWVTDGKGRVLIHRRPQKGLLGGMAGLPTSNWVTDKKEIVPPAIFGKTKETSPMPRITIEHTFTHFDLQLALHKAEMLKVNAPDYYWIKTDEIKDAGLPTVFSKVLKIFEKA